MDNLSNKKMIRARDIANRYSIGLSTVWSYVRKGYLKNYKISDQITLFKVDEVESFFENGGIKAIKGGE